MIGVVLSGLAQVTMQAPPAESKAAVEAFRDGCTRGSLKLPASRGRILKANEVPDFADVIQWGRPTRNYTVIKFNYPRSTYLIFADFISVQPKSIAKVCVLVSHAISRDDATEAFLETPPATKPEPACTMHYCVPAWTIDRPDLGYRKRLAFRDDDSIFLEVATYTQVPKTPGRNGEQ